MNSKRKRNNRDECEESEFRQQMKCNKCGHTTDSVEPSHFGEVSIVEGDSTFFSSYGRLFCPECFVKLLEQHCGVMEDLE